MKMPRATEFDSTLSLLRQGYELVPNMSRKLGSDIYAGRLLLRKAIFMTGEEAARLFYDNEKFQRHDAMPKRVQKTLLGIGGVQGLDDECHRHRTHDQADDGRDHDEVPIALQVQVCSPTRQ